MKSWTILLLLSLGALAQDKPDFSGKWGLDTEKSDFGEFPAPASQTNLIEHKDPNIKLIQTIRADAIPGGVASSERHYSTDAKESLNKIGEREGKSICKWDGNKLVIATKLESPDGTLEIEDSWELSGGGKQMVVTRNFKGPQGERSQKLVFSKQQ